MEHYTSASFLVTEHCNLACTYCFEQHKTEGLKVMSQDVAERGIDFIFRNAVQSESKESEIILFGGEPLLNAKLCIHIISYAYEMGQRMGVNPSINIITNATLKDDKLGKVIKEYLPQIPINLQLSVDGPKEIQDRYRVKKDGSGSFDMIPPVVEWWKGIFKDFPNRISIHSCVNKETIEAMHSSMMFFKKELGVERLWYLPVCEEEWTAEDVEVYRKQTELITDYLLFRSEKENSIKPITDVDPYGKLLHGNEFMASQRKPCGFGDSFCTITAVGDIYPCHQLYYAEGGELLKLGDIFKGIDPAKGAIFREYDGNDMSCPSDCDHGGCYRCPAINWQLYKSFTTQKRGFYCELMKIDQENQRRIAKEVEKMGLMKDQHQCNQHTPDTTHGCDVVVGGPVMDDCDIVTRDRVMSEPAPGGDYRDQLIRLQRKKIEFDAAYIEKLHKLMMG